MTGVGPLLFVITKKSIFSRISNGFKFVKTLVVFFTLSIEFFGATFANANTEPIIWGILLLFSQRVNRSESANTPTFSRILRLNIPF